MAERPELSDWMARMMTTCQTIMFGSASRSTSRQCARGSVSGTFSQTSAAPSTGSPSSMLRARKLSGG